MSSKFYNSAPPKDQVKYFCKQANCSEVMRYWIAGKTIDNQLSSKHPGAHFPSPNPSSSKFNSNEVWQGCRKKEGIPNMGCSSSDTKSQLSPEDSEY
mmetsp:Transcript_26605/g.35458  ORF Transcript_26605/g.35458 Transcript_26605/m.35458 type:complete len:97 (-) Transcript_26605:23-313(-)